MKFFKKTITTILALCVAAATLSFAACVDTTSGSGSSGSGSSNKGADTSDVEIQNFDYGFIDADNYDVNTTTISDCVKTTSLDAGTDYYFILKFDIAARQANKGTALLTINIELDNIDIMTGTISESNGVSVPMEFVDAGTGNNVLQYSTDYKIPESVDNPKTIYIVMELIPVTIGQSHIYLLYETDGFEIYGEQNDGLTKDLTINAVQLDKPTISWNQTTMTLSWYQIKNADYYVFYVDEELLYDSNGKVVSVDANPDIAVGDEVLYTKLSDYVSGMCAIKVQACSDNSTIYKSSSLSDYVYVTLYS